jgi:predicted nucleic acid-binding protein
LARTGKVEGVTCQELLDELIETLTVKLRFTSEQALDSVIDLLTFLRPVPITGRLQVVAADPDDDKTLECALVGGAAYIVTGDRRHLLPLQSFQGIQIVTAADFLGMVQAP